MKKDQITLQYSPKTDMAEGMINDSTDASDSMRQFTGVRLDTTGVAGYCVRENPRDPQTTVMRHMSAGFVPGFKQDIYFYGFGKHLCVENHDLETTLFPGLRWIIKGESGNEDGYFELLYMGKNFMAFNICSGNQMLQVEHDTDGWNVLKNLEPVARIESIEINQRQRFEEDGFDVETCTHFMISKDIDEYLCLYIMAIPLVGW